MDRPPHSYTALEHEELEKFMGALTDYRPAIPDELVRHHLARAGLETNDTRVERLIALAAQKFVADVANDAITQSGVRTRSSRKPKDGRITLTLEDLERALRDYGVMLKKPAYFADSMTAGAQDVQPPKTTK